MIKRYPDNFIERTIYHIRRIIPIRVREYIYDNVDKGSDKPTMHHVYHWTMKPDEYFNGRTQYELYDVHHHRHLLVLTYNIGVAVSSALLEIPYDDDY